MKTLGVVLLGHLLIAAAGFSLGSWKAAWGLTPKEVIAAEGEDYVERFYNGWGETGSLRCQRALLEYPAELTYFFWQDRMHRFTYRVSQDVVEQLLRALTAKYGVGRQHARDGGRNPLHYWLRQRVLIGLTAAFPATYLLYGDLGDPPPVVELQAGPGPATP